MSNIGNLSFSVHLQDMTDADIAKMVVDAKSEIEKLREQIQNVE